MFAVNPELFAPEVPVEEIVLRNYQLEAVERARENVITGIDAQIISAFVGAGKTVMAAYKILTAFRKNFRATFVVDRLSLLGQTSAMFDRYGIPHGVIQAENARFFPDERVQIASVQTLMGRGWPKSDVIFIDECHTMHKTTTDRILAGGAKIVGLSATPFTRGLGRFYKAVVDVRTPNQLLADGFIAPFRVFSHKAPNMKGVKIVAGEYHEGQASERAQQIVGSVVEEYLKNGENKKAIYFATDVAHAEKLLMEARQAGIAAELFTYRTPQEERDYLIDPLRGEFRKPDSKVRWLISVAALAKGFDVPDVEIIGMCRPYKASFAEFVQAFGRGLRTAIGKQRCTVLDHAGNFDVHCDALVDFMEHGCPPLDDGKKKEPKKKEEHKERKSVVCPDCHCRFDRHGVCPECGFKFQVSKFGSRKSEIEHTDGELGEFDLRAKRIVAPRSIFVGDILRNYNPNHKPASPAFERYIRSLGVNIGRGPFSAMQLMKIKLRYEAKNKTKPITK